MVEFRALDWEEYLKLFPLIKEHGHKVKREQTTVSLDEDLRFLVRYMKRNDFSDTVNKLLREHIEAELKENEKYQAARQKAIDKLEG